MAKKLKIKTKTKKHKMSLPQMKAHFFPLQEEARARIKKLRESKSTYYSRAYNEAKETKSNASRRIFDINAQNTYEDLQREVARIKVFLADESSMSDVANMEAELLRNARKWGRDFGSQWTPIYGHSYNMGKIDEDLAKMAFKMYRKIESESDSYNKIYGQKIGYGSDNLIYLIMDAVYENDIRDYEGDYKDIFDKTFEELRQRFEDIYKIRNDMAEEEYRTGNVDTGLLNDVADEWNKKIF